MYRMNSWLGGRMLAFDKWTKHYGDHDTQVYTPHLAGLMETGAVSSQGRFMGLTTPGRFFNGANSWLRERNTNLRLHGGGYVFTLNFLPVIGWAAWNTEVWKMYGAAMSSIGLRNEPGIALHRWGDLASYHYSPTLEARLYNWRVRAEVLTRVSWSEGSPLDGKFVNISRFNAIAGGFYALY